jgi:hemolysin III
MVVIASQHGNGWHITSSSIYGATLILMYSASTLYHSIPLPKIKKVLQQLDHASIYLLIAGTYTPFLLVTLRQGVGWLMFAVIWGVALLGVCLEIFQYKPFKHLSMWLYMIMGWMVVLAIVPMWQNVSGGGLLLLLAGGLAYTCGAIFYVRKQMPYHHVIWHLFVLAGSILHYFSILFYVMP